MEEVVEGGERGGGERWKGEGVVGGVVGEGVVEGSGWEGVVEGRGSSRGEME